MKVKRINIKEEQEFEPVTIKITFESFDELKKLREELKQDSFKLYELVNNIISEIEE